MIRESKKDSLGFDDVILQPVYSTIDSRNDVRLENQEKLIPIFSAPMKNISEPDLVIEMGRLGGVGILHRYFNSAKDQSDSIIKISKTKVNFGVSIGIRNLYDELEYAFFSVSCGAKFIVIDVASGYLAKTSEATKRLYEFRDRNRLDFYIVVGNVVDFAGACLLADAGADFIRVGIGTGSLCLTSKSIGIGCSPLTAMNSCLPVKSIYPDVRLIMDGGIRNPGDALKAFAFGADAVMIGGLFGRAKEANNNGHIYGMSSFVLQKVMGKQLKSREGIEIQIPDEEIRPLEDIFNEFTFGLKSGLSYLGCDNLASLKDLDIEYMRV